MHTHHLPVPRHRAHARGSDYGQRDVGRVRDEVPAERERRTGAREGGVAHEVRPADEHGRVRAELPEVLQAPHRVGVGIGVGVGGRMADRGRPERRGGRGVREEHELRVRVPDRQQPSRICFGVGLGAGLGEDGDGGVVPGCAAREWGDESYARRRGPRACPFQRERELVRLRGGAVQEEDVPRPDRAREEHGRGGVQERAARAERVVGDDELALAPVERDAPCGLWERERALRRRHREREAYVRPRIDRAAISAEFVEFKEGEKKEEKGKRKGERKRKRDARRRRVPLARHVEPRPAVRVPERRDEGRAPVERDAGDAHARVAHPVRLQELR